MPSNVQINQVTANLQSANYQTTAFQTEDGSNTTFLTSFSWAGGTSSYSFGLFQFDTVGSPLAIPLLQNLGFSTVQINELKQSGGLSQSTLGGLNSQLSSALSTQSGSAYMQGANNAQASSITSQVQTDLNDASTTILSSILSDPVAIQRLYDLNNQFSLPTLSSLQTFVGGDAATPPGGNQISWDYSRSASSNLESFFWATAFGGTSGATTRNNAFYNAVNAENLPNTTVDLTSGSGSDANSFSFAKLQNVTLNLADGISASDAVGSAGDTFNIHLNVNPSYPNANLTSSVTVTGGATISAGTSVEGDAQLTLNGANATANLAADSSLVVTQSGDIVHMGSGSNVDTTGGQTVTVTCGNLPGGGAYQATISDANSSSTVCTVASNGVGTLTFDGTAGTITTNGSGANLDLVGGGGNTVNATGTQSTVTEADNSTGANSDIINISNSTINTGANDKTNVGGSGNAITGGTGGVVTLLYGDQNDNITASNTTISLQSNVAGVNFFTGSGDTISGNNADNFYVIGSNDNATLGTGNIVGLTFGDQNDNITASNSTITLQDHVGGVNFFTGNNDTISGGNSDNFYLIGSNSAATVGQWASVGLTFGDQNDNITASNSTITLQDHVGGVNFFTGNNDTISGGNSDNFYLIGSNSAAT
ncbi:MAG: beta strand repeat-containing protein, partial [Phenylobacterium sp.]